MLFDPAPAWICTPGQLKMDYAEWDVPVSTKASVKAWHIPAGGPSNRVALLCRSLAANMSYDLELAAFWKDMGFDVVLFDYRGFGKSKGRPDEQGILADATAVYQRMMAELQIDEAHVLIYGRSGGGVVAAHLAQTMNPAALVLESVYPDWSHQARHHGMPLNAWYLGDALDLSKRLSVVDLPALIIQSEHDDVVPLAHGRKVYESQPANKELLIAQGQHGDAIFASRSAYREAVMRIAISSGMREDGGPIEL